MASRASELADTARGLVSTYADGYAHGGELVEAAARVLGDAKQLLELAVAYERRRGTSWEIIGENLGVSRQAAHDRFAEAEARLAEEILRDWLLSDDPSYPASEWDRFGFAGLHEGITDTAKTAERLDWWVTRNLQPEDGLAHHGEDEPDRQRPVSHHLPPLDIGEHSAMVLAAVTMLSRRIGIFPDDLDAWRQETRQLELGLARRKIEFYERALAEEQGGKRTGYERSTDEVRDLLAGARTRLAELQGTPW